MVVYQVHPAALAEWALANQTLDGPLWQGNRPTTMLLSRSAVPAALAASEDGVPLEVTLPVERLEQLLQSAFAPEIGGADLSKRARSLAVRHAPVLAHPMRLEEETVLCLELRGPTVRAYASWPVHIGPLSDPPRREEAYALDHAVAERLGVRP